MRMSLSRVVRSIALVTMASQQLSCSGSTAASDAQARVVGTPDAACDARAYDDAGTGPCTPYWLDGGNGCMGGNVFFPCGLPAASVDPNATSLIACAPFCMGSQNFNVCWTLGDAGPIDQAFNVDAGGGPTIVNCAYSYTGRRPPELLKECAPDARTIGDALAHAAYLEAASVVAFKDLQSQLEAHGAPRALVLRLRCAASDEVRHARVMRGLAHSRGGKARAVKRPRTAKRPLLAIALENAREGCVRETWGAACAVVQSLRACDPELRAAMRGIARDELRHAQLSMDLGKWLGTRLTEKERLRVDQERADAIHALKHELDATTREEWHEQLGLPTYDEACAILREMRARIWATSPDPAC